MTANAASGPPPASEAPLPPARPGVDPLPAPVFILAPPRSFTSLICAMLGQHPALYGLPELNLFQCGTMAEFNTGRNPDGSVKSPFWATMRHGLLRVVAELYGGEQTIESVNMAERWLRQRVGMDAGAVYREVAARVAPLRVVDKSPGYLRNRLYLERIVETFPEARFIHLTRHPRGQCESVLKTKGGPAVLFTLNALDRSGPEPVLDPQILWHDSQVQVMNFLEPLPADRWIRVRGEDLLNDLDAGLGGLCRWLGIDDSPEAVAAMKRPEDSPYSGVGPVNARLGNDINFLKAPSLREGGVTVPSLDGPVSWRPDERGFHPWVDGLARDLGYT